MTKKQGTRKTKVGKLTPAEASPSEAPSGPVATPASMIYRNIKALLLGALHPGAHAQHVAESVRALDEVIEAIEADAAKKSAEPTGTLTEAPVNG